MSKPMFLSIFLLCFFAAVTSSAQHTATFELSMPQSKVDSSIYNKLTVVDSRSDTSDMGIVQTGALNRKAKVVAALPIPVMLTKVFNSMHTDKAGSNELLLQLRQLSFAELTGAMSEKGYCYFRADAYAKHGEQYKKIRSVDTVILVKAMDVTRAVFRKGSEVVAGFIAASMQKYPVGNTYTYQDILDIENIEKQGLKLYTASLYTDGLYLTYKAFANQTPDKAATVATDATGKIVTVRVADENGKMQKIKAQSCYAIVYKGQPYVATKFDYYPIKKVNNDFLFTGKANVTANVGDVMVASVFFGIIGSLIASNAEATFEMKLDHINGGFIRIKEITEPSEAASAATSY